MVDKKWIGDKGETTLHLGMQVSKKSPRVEAYGTVDELNSFIGLAIAETGDKEIIEILEDVQKDLFFIGSDLATPLYNKIRRVDAERNRALEQLIKKMDRELGELKNFILPNGSRAAATMHVCRTICRRAERQIVALKDQESINEEILAYMNRLSYLLFLLARLENQRAGVKEKLWKG